jgi:hypothetical protein
MRRDAVSLHESKNAGYTDLGRLHQHLLGDTPPAAHQPRLKRPEPEGPVLEQAAPEGAESDQAIPEGSESEQAVTTEAVPQAEPRSPETDPSQGSSQGPTRRALHEHAGLWTSPEEQERLAGLAELAEPENWAGPGDNGGDGLWVLREYVEWTFERLHQQGQVATSADGGHSVFNTGLATPQQETLYGLFVRNPDPDNPDNPDTDPDGPPWRLGGWLAESDSTLARHFPELPELARYTDEPGELVYDWRRELVVIPRRLLDTKASLAVLPGPLRSNPYQAGLVLEGAVRRAEARVRRSHRAAVPCWDPAHDRVRLLLPLSLTTPESVDMALMVSSEADGYRGHAILGLDEAYARARQIARPGEWLTAR